MTALRTLEMDVRQAEGSIRGSDHPTIGRLDPRTIGRRPRRSVVLGGLVLFALVAGACASSRAFSRAQHAAEAGDWDAAVASCGPDGPP